MSERGAPPSLRIDLRHPLLVDRSGRGVRVAVIDSGISPGHAHVGDVAGGLAIVDHQEGLESGHQAAHGGTRRTNIADRLGHGTAVAAAIREKAPEAELYAIKVFDRVLAATANELEAAIEAAVQQGCRLLNLSLGTDSLEHEERLRRAVARAQARGAVIVSPRRHRGQRWLPGSLPGVAAVDLDWELERHEVTVEPQASGLLFRASGYPRPVPGVPREGNLRGISFAAANVSGMLARLLEDGQLSDLEELCRAATSETR